MAGGLAALVALVALGALLANASRRRPQQLAPERAPEPPVVVQAPAPAAEPPPKTAPAVAPPAAIQVPAQAPPAQAPVVVPNPSATHPAKSHPIANRAHKPKPEVRETRPPPAGPGTKAEPDPYKKVDELKSPYPNE